MDILLNDLQPGQNYVIQLRSKNAGGVSAWSRAYTIATNDDTVAPGPITNLSWRSLSTSYLATWSKPLKDSLGNELKDLKDYKITLTAGSKSVVYYVAQERFDFTLEANSAAFGSPQITVKIEIQARDQIGNLSTVVQATVVNEIPQDVTNFAARSKPNAISLTWDAVNETDLHGYELHTGTTLGFVPDSTNMIYSGPSTAFLFASSDEVEQYFKIRAVDAFGQGSAHYAVISSMPELPTGLDTSPPATPTNVVATTVPAESGQAEIAVSWDAVTSSNLRYYTVRYSTDEVTWQFVNVPSDKTSTRITGLVANTNYFVSVAAVSQVNSSSPYATATPYPIKSAVDTTPPSRPSAPSVSVGPLMAQVLHNMTKNSGGNLESDVSYLEVHASTVSGFTPSTSTLRGTINAAGPGIPVQGVFSFTDLSLTATQVYWKVVAVDTSDNKSSSSPDATGIPGLLDGANILDATITSAKIQTLKAEKIEANSVFINNLAVRSTLTLDAAASQIKTSTYNASNRTGWKLDQQGLTIYDGTIDAKALQLQDSQNLVPPQFADFEFASDYYSDSTNVANAEQMTAPSGMSVALQSAIAKIGSRALRVWNSNLAWPNTHPLTFSKSSFDINNLNVVVDPGQYIFSVWARKNGTQDQNIILGFYTDTDVRVAASGILVNNTAFTRYSAVLTIPSGVSKGKLYIEVQPANGFTGYDLILDAMQFERKIGALTTPSAWTPPSSTTIDGGAIVTGSIRSSAPSPTVANQPAWSLNTSGGLQVGDASVRGTIVVGDPSAFVNLMPNEYSTFEQPSSFYHNGAGLANPANMRVDDTGVVLSIQNSGAYVGNQALRIYSTTRTAPTPIILGPADALYYNIKVVPNTTYYFSMWVKSTDTSKTNQRVKIGAYRNSIQTDVIVTSLPLTGTWSRKSGTYTTDAFTTMIQFVIIADPNGGTGFDFAVDGLMVEFAQAGQTTPSNYAIAGDSTSYMKSAGYRAGYSGWSINSDGSVEFNNGKFRGSVDISEFISGQTYNMNIQNRKSQFQYSDNGDTTPANMTNIGLNPTMTYSGYAIQNVTAADGNTVLDMTSQVQGVSRLTPAGQYQIMFDPNNTSDIFDVDGNNLFDASGNPKNASYSFATSEWGSRRVAPGQATRRSYINHTTRSAMKDLASGSTSPKLKTYSTYDAETSAESGLWYNIQNHTSMKTGGYNNFVSGNKMKAGFDTFADSGGLSFYTANTVVNRLTLAAITPNIWAAARKDLNSLKMTIASGTGNPMIYLSKANTYDFAVTPGQYHIVSGWFSTTQQPLQVRAVIKLSNGTFCYGPFEYINKQNPPANATYTNFPYAYGYNASILVPAGSPSTATVAFEFSGAVDGHTIYMTALTFANATSDVDRVRFAPIGASENVSGSAWVETSFEPYPSVYEWAPAATYPGNSTTIWDRNAESDRSKITLGVDWQGPNGRDYRVATLNRNGVAVGALQDNHMPNGVILNTLGVYGSAGANFRGGLQGFNWGKMNTMKEPSARYDLQYAENGSLTEGGYTINGLAAGWYAQVLHARRGGIYLLNCSCKVALDTSTGADIWWIELWKIDRGDGPPSAGTFITSQEFGRGSQYATLTTIVDALIDDMFYFVIASKNSAGNRDIANVRMGMVQLL